MSFGDGGEKSSDGAFVVRCVLLFVLGLGWDGLGWVSFLRAPMAVALGTLARVPMASVELKDKKQKNY